MLTILFIGFSISSCKKYLDAKPNLSLSTINSLEDLQALLNHTTVLNAADPEIGEVECDDYYVSYANWQSADVDDQNLYYWDPNEIFDEWSSTYEAVYCANVVLDNISNFNDVDSLSEYNSIEGQALFFRGFTFYKIAQIYSPTLNATTQSEPLGICLRLTSSITAPSARSTVQQTYNQIIQDLSMAAKLLPVISTYKTTPNKAGAYGALAKVYLSMEDYTNAEKYADSCLSLYNTLIDYNTLSQTATYPFSLFNDEVIFHSEYQSSGILSNSSAVIDSSLRDLYQVNDLRSTLFFAVNSDGTSSFKGDYSGNDYGYPEFDGIATDEIYLIKSECEARNGDVADAISDLNTLLIKRWKTGTFVADTATNASSALSQILTERRKEFVFRNIRWSDLKRLNQDPNYAVTLTRNLNGTVYTLAPGDLRYESLIPASVISLAGIQQNPR